MIAGQAADTRNERLLEWYRASKRNLPWRHTTDPYRILVSETMLQQTQAERVIPYYERFVAEFPDIESLAASHLEAVLRAWSGLGYNSRAKRLRDAARMIATGGWPDDLTELPGVGPYTAAAVACFARGDHVPTVDTNLRRVISRWEGAALDGPRLHERATALLGDNAADWNQAVMDLGAHLCTPRRPRCDDCPVARWCSDPSVYVAPHRQSRFDGSVRQVRGAVVRALTDGPLRRRQLEAATGYAGARLEQALEALRREDLVEGPPYRLSD